MELRPECTYIPGTCLSSIFSHGPPRNEVFPIKTMVIWVIYNYIISRIMDYVKICQIHVTHSSVSDITTTTPNRLASQPSTWLLCYFIDADASKTYSAARKSTFNTSVPLGNRATESNRWRSSLRSSEVVDTRSSSKEMDPNDFMAVLM